MESFEELLRANRLAVERLVLFKIPNRADGEDVLQETYLAALRGFEGLRDPASFKPWLLEIARRKCADYFRRRRNDAPLEEAEGLIDGGETLPLVEETLAEMTERDREILRLYFWRELTQSEIAKRLHIPVGTVKSRLHTAKGRFKALYPAPEGLKGETNMLKLPEFLPKYTITPTDKEPFRVRWEELPGWMIIPRLGEKLTWGLYDQPTGRRTEWCSMEVTGRAEVHGIEGVEIVAVQHDTEDYYRTGAIPEIERRFVAQLTDTHSRFLAESHMEDGVRRCYTFLDGERFLNNWGFGPNNCGQETDLRRKGILTREGDVITGEMKPNLQSLDVVGRYEVTIGGKTYDTVCVMDIECFDDAVASEEFIDQQGRMILWRRFNRNDWAFHRYGKLWTELLPANQRLTVNGETYVHWYDCVTDYIF